MKYKCILVLGFSLSLCPLSLCGENTSLESLLAPLAKAHQGKVAIAVKNLATGECYTLNADEPMPTASLCKFPVMVEAYYQFSEGKAKPTDVCVYERDPKVSGSGILVEHFTPGMTFCLRDAIHMMIVWSDNMATNIVLDHIGIASTAKRMESLGLPNTKIHSKVFRRDTTVFPERSKQFGLGSTTANEMIKLLTLLHENKLVGPEACKEMLDHMKKCDDKDKLTRFLPAGTVVAHKTGSMNETRTDAGIIYVPMSGSNPKRTQPIAVCVMTNDNTDHSWRPDNAGNLICAKAAKAVYDYYAAKK
jgi:beta-lactamase class A